MCPAPLDGYAAPSSRARSRRWRSAAWVLGASLLAACGRDPAPTTDCVLPSGASVLAIGDSLTRGQGADGAGYAEQLQALLDGPGGRAGVTVHNRGINGERSAGLRARIDDALRQDHPAVVLITIGGNDFLRRVDANDTQRELRAIVDRVRDAGAAAFVFGIPRPGIGAAVGLLDEHPLFEALAQDGRAVVIPDVVTQVLSDADLRADPIHPNRDGYARMARAAFERLSGCR